MKRLIIAIPLAAVFFLTAISTFAQTVTYLDVDHNVATAESYVYKRVIKYKEPVLNPNIGMGYYGNLTSNVQPTGLHICSLIDYYKSGEPALVVNVLTLDLRCSRWAFDGMAISYFKNGTIKQKAPYKVGKLHGTVIKYDEDGNELKREEYENGKLIEANKFLVSADSPLIGTWRYEERTAPFVVPNLNINRPGSLTKLLTAVFSSNGILEITVQEGFVGNQSFLGGKEKTNWKYVARSSSSGVLEQYQGDELLYRGSVKWIDSNQFEYVNTFHQNPNMVGQRYTYTRQ